MRHSLDDNIELTKYLEQVANHDLLSFDEEFFLTKRWRDRSDPPTQLELAAREELIEKNMKLIISIAKGYRNRGLSFIELIQEGVTGMIRALKTYNPEKGFRLSTYATWWIRQACQRAVSGQGNTIRVPAHVNFRRARTYEILEKHPDATIEEIAAILKCKPHHIEEALDVVRATFSLDRSSPTEGDASGIADKVADPYSEDPADALEHRDFMRAREVHESLSRIEGEERRVLELRFGFGTHPHSFAEISKALNIPSHRCQQIQKTALRKLERIMESDTMLSPEYDAQAAAHNTARLAPSVFILHEDDVEDIAAIGEFMQLHHMDLAAADVDNFIADVLGRQVSYELIDEPCLGRCDHAYESAIQEDLREDELTC